MTATDAGTLQLIQFVRYGHAVCAAFEKHPFSGDEQEQSLKHELTRVKRSLLAVAKAEQRPAEGRNEGIGSTYAKESAAVGCKFLTSSQLFHLELRDPALRLQMCAQMLIYLYNVK